MINNILDRFSFLLIQTVKHVHTLVYYEKELDFITLKSTRINAII